MSGFSKPTPLIKISTLSASELRERFSLYEKLIPLSSPSDRQSDFDAMWLIVLESFRRTSESKDKSKAMTRHLSLMTRAIKLGKKHNLVTQVIQTQFSAISRQIILDIAGEGSQT